jgi:CRP-like cAMP-binding protein
MRAPALPLPQQTLLECAMLRRRRLDPGTDIYHQGDDAGDFMIVASGWVGLFKLLPDGGRQFLKFALPGDLIGFSASESRERDHAAVSLTEAVLCVGGRSLAQQLLRDPAAMTRITDALVAEQAAILDQLIGMARQSALQRVAHLAMDLFERAQGRPPYAGAEMDLPLTQEQIGDYLGLTAIHVNRMLGQLRRAGAAAVGRRKLKIISPERLRALANDSRYEASTMRPTERLAAAA